MYYNCGGGCLSFKGGNTVAGVIAVVIVSSTVAINALEIIPTPSSGGRWFGAGVSFGLTGRSRRRLECLVRHSFVITIIVVALGHQLRWVMIIDAQLI